MKSIGSLVLIVVTAFAGVACNATPQIKSNAKNGGSSASTPAGQGGTSGGPSGPGVVITLPDAGSGPPPVPPAAVSYPGGITRPCANLECRQATCVMGDCKQPACSGGKRTSLHGRVFDPAGKVPLYNVVLYVPNEELAPITTGPGCDRCDSPVSGKPITSTLSDTRGDFVLDNVPVGTDVPLVIQIGKWRRQITLPEMTSCSENVINDPNLLRLPRTQKEGNIPKIALTTGGYDRLECLLRKMGIDDSEFTTDAGTGRVNLYAGAGSGGNPATVAYAPTVGAGATFPTAVSFWDDAAKIKQYDLVALSCEGNWNLDQKSMAARQNLVDYTNGGGRVFASHWHGAWIQFGPNPWDTVAKFVPASNSGNMNQLPDLPDQFPTDINTGFPKGAALAEWLVNVMASPTQGKLPINQGKHSVLSVDPMRATAWIQSATIPLVDRNTEASGVQYLSFNTPVGADMGKECGRTVFTDIHVSAGDTAGPPFPVGCVTTELSPQEKALEFMLFDLSSCIQPDKEIPKPPIIP